MISEFTMVWNLLHFEIYHSLILIPYKVGELLLKYSIIETEVTALSRRTSILIYEYKPSQSSATSTDSIKHWGVFLDSKLHFHNHVSYMGCFVNVLLP
jgi:hypothetical protein